MNTAKLQKKLVDNTDRMGAMLDKADSENRDLSISERREYKSLRDEAYNVRSLLENTVEPRKIITAVNDAAPARPLTGQSFNFASNDEAYRSGMWLLAQVGGHEQAARWCNDHGLDIKAAAGGGINTAGGFLVPDELSSAIINLQEQYGVFRRFARVMPMTSDTLSVPRKTGGLTAYFVGENTTGTESDATWDNVSLTAKKLMILTRMSSELNEDAVIDFANFMSDEMAQAFSLKEDTAGFNGDGTSTHGGIVGVTQKLIDGTHTAGAVDCATANADTFVEVAALDLSTLMSKLPAYALPNAKWYCSQTAFSLVFERLVQAAGGNTMIILGGRAQMQYLGYPIVVSQVLPTATTSLDNEVMLMFGDLSKAAMLGARREVRVMATEDRYFELDQIGIRGTERIDINVHDLGDTTTAGPIVGLVGAA